MISKLILPLLAVGLLSACASNRNQVCGGTAEYRSAGSVEPVKGMGEIAVPESPAALRIPPPSKPEATLPEPKNRNRRTSCADFPPAIDEKAAQ
jgi:hypothetical protein